MKKQGAAPTLTLVENPDILASVAALNQPPYCVGFAAESENLLEYARIKREKKKIPLIVANLAQQAMGADSNEVVLLDAGGAHPLPAMPKSEVAAAIVRELANRLAAC
jgi:phosphopantothenoylcysteine decarboxylase/phosphopantothenate--cysteine ligase